ncbi:MAG: glyoxalase [Pseudomonadota bacterium]|nr:glyoxalase [Pseudomonadota bacterium]
MSIALNHISIRTLDVGACERFYAGLLGLVSGPRPPFPFPGVWLYAGDTSVYANAVMHIIGIDQAAPEGLQGYLGNRDDAGLKGSGAVDHVAFFATGLQQMLTRLHEESVACRERTVPSLGLYQVFVEDPNGIVVELNYPAAEGAALVR